MTNYYQRYDYGIIRVKVPVPFPLKWVNAYLLKDNDKYVIIDPGLHTDKATEVWQLVLQELDISPGKIGKVVLTHHHPDHYGLAGWMQEWTGCEVYMSPEGHQLTQRMWGPAETMTDELYLLFEEHGLPSDKLIEMREHMRGFIPLVSPQPEVRYLTEGDEWQAGELTFRTLTVSGHAWRHLVFIDEEKKLMFCGDHVLPRITPNISFIPDEDPDPLASFLQGLDKLATCDVNMVFPGHRDPLVDLGTRINELKLHHEERLQTISEKLGKPLTAYEVCVSMFGERLSVHQLRFAMSETIAHLVYLNNRKKVRQVSVRERIGQEREHPLIGFIRES